MKLEYFCEVLIIENPRGSLTGKKKIENELNFYKQEGRTIPGQARLGYDVTNCYKDIKPDLR